MVNSFLVTEFVEFLNSSVSVSRSSLSCFCSRDVRLYSFSRYNYGFEGVWNSDL